MKGICPNCEKITELEYVRATEEIEVRGDIIPTEVDYYRCNECNIEFEDPNSENDPLEKAYVEYRRKHDLLQPEEIRFLRKQYGLTQNQLSTLLGWGGATISRYENGALQDEAHDRLLQLIKSPENLYELITTKGDVLPDSKKKSLLKDLSNIIDKKCSYPNFYQERFGRYEPNIDSGYKGLDLNKLFQAAIFFSKEGVFKTKLCKLLFYADFKHYKDYAISITGSKYAHADHGPVPDNYEHYFAALYHDEQSITIREKVFEDFSGEEFISMIEPDLSIFSDTELEVIAKIKNHFKSYTATKIREFSHNEKGYKETQNGDIISYKYSNDLQI